MNARTLGAAIALAVSAVTANAQARLPPGPFRRKARAARRNGAPGRARLGQSDEAATVLDAVKLIKTGEIIELAHVLGPAMPFFGTRRFDVHVKRSFMNTGSNERGSNEEMVLLRDRPGRHAVRRLRAPDPSQQSLQLLQDRGDRGPPYVQQARHPERRCPHHARRADRRRGLQGRRDAGR